MKNLLLILSLLISSITIAQGTRQSYHDMLKTYYKNTVPTIQPANLYKKVLKNESIYILDTREDSEFNTSSIKGSIQVGYDKFDIQSTNSFDKDATIIVYCTIGARSESIGEKLIKDGFKNVYNLYGGLIYWKNQGYPVIDSKGVITKNIHVYSEEWGKWLRKGNPIY
jgi:rhodanese-related sulfurtransferase